MRTLTILLAILFLVPSLTLAQGKRRAVVVGVAGFEHGYASLDYTARDARRTASALEDLGYSVSLLAADADAGEVKYADVLTALKTAAGKSQPGDTLLFFFAGHGSRRSDKDYLLLSDSDPDKFATTALALDTLSDIVTGSKATRRVFVIDACRNTTRRADGKTGFTDGKLDSGFKDSLDKLTTKQEAGANVQTAVLYACSPGETSKESVEERAGIFTQRFIQALQRPGQNGLITIGSVVEFVRTHMPAAVDQTPALSGPPLLELRPRSERPGVAAPERPIGQSGAWPTKVNPKDDAEMVYIPGGEFVMGQPGIFDGPPNPVRLTKGYWMYRTAVTVGQYARFCTATGRQMPDPPPFNPGWKNRDHPIVGVTWNDAVAYCDWAGASLPTEAQYERAARGPEHFSYPWGNRFDPNMCWCSKNRSGDAGGTCAVGKFAPNGYGLYDIVGNSWTWCVDYFGPRFYGNGEAVRVDPVKTTANTATERIIRGGSWFDSTWNYLHCAIRGWARPDDRRAVIGFRCVVPGP